MVTEFLYDIREKDIEIMTPCDYGSTIYTTTIYVYQVCIINWIVQLRQRQSI